MFATSIVKVELVKSKQTNNKQTLMMIKWYVNLGEMTAREVREASKEKWHFNYFFFSRKLCCYQVAKDR